MFVGTMESYGLTLAAATDPTSLLSDISQKLNVFQSSVLPLPANISKFATSRSMEDRQMKIARVRS